ncbi:MAG: ABC transporter permease [Terracidiphilus sp.]|jgi:putative ABC transport system permease protein
MPPLARRNLFHDKIRLAVTLTGIAFSVVLIVVQWGLFQGFSSSTTSIIDNSGADIWIAAKGTVYLEQAAPFNERKYYQVLATPGVGSAMKFILRWSGWKQPSGRWEGVAIIGCDPDSAMGGPFHLVAGDAQQLKQPNAVIIDKIYADKLDAHQIGDMVEINGYQAKVVGFTDGIRAFTTNPYVFTTFKRALDFAAIPADKTNFVLVKTALGVDPKTLKADLQARLPDNDVFLTTEFSKSTQHYWMFKTGAGTAVLMAAVLGLVVGIAVVTQTIYASTMDHIREYGTLKAMGAPNSYVLGVILQQAAIAAVLGYVIGMTASVFVVHAASKGGANILLTWKTAIEMQFLTIFMCGIAAVVSIKKILGLDPAMVFKG